jgi:hypothetical protein
MHRRGGLWLVPLLLLLNACNMAMSETPMFSDTDRGSLLPRDGVWVAEDSRCRFDVSQPGAEWPECAGWIVLRNSGGELLVRDGKGESQPARFVIAKGEPPIVQVLWRDDAKEDGKTFYVFFGLEPGTVDPDGKLVAASSWEVQCGVKGENASDIKPYPGISPECRPSTQDAIRSAAVASRATAEMAMRWRWLRPETR